MDKRQALDYISDSQRTIAGQHCEYLARDTQSGYDRFFAPLQVSCGDVPLYPGLTLGLGATAAECKAAISFLVGRGHWLFDFDHHANNPWTGGDSWDVSVSRMAELTTNANWLAELDKLVDVFLYAKSLGVVGMWRPFHQMNSDRGFWWDWGCAGKTVTPFKDAWQHMYTYLSSRGVDNLIWNYCCLGIDWTVLYGSMMPSASTVDLVSVTSYSQDATIPGDSYSVLVGLGKPLGFGEAGPYGATGDAVLWLDSCKSRYPAMRFIQFWHSWPECGAALVDMANAGTFLGDSHIITRNKFEGGSTPPPPQPAPTATLAATIRRSWWGWWAITLTWSTTNATSAKISGIGDVALSGYRTIKVNRRGTYTYALTATAGDGRTATAYASAVAR